ncbi:hypothetical protein BD311DRAFT_356777 [Dichomitus squalens]|uniref:F-box domain-containing protein n=1 Tax=Dichomitus squalens TaxID=114155 RepID=A0A4Q9MNI5_9APHY|nr:hypothetical protein BD311DRAFT_356777 [Dichomitus squalens]
MAARHLNAEVLAVVCDFLTDKPDVLSFSLTCSAVRPVATQRLLSMAPVVISSSKSLRCLHSFLFSDAAARTPYVRALTVDSPNLDEGEVSSYDPEDTPLLLDILSSTPCLYELSITLHRTPNGCVDDLRVLDALVQLHTMRALNIDGESPALPELVARIRAPLRKLGVLFVNLKGDWWHPAAFEKFLPHLAPTLEELHVNDFCLDHSDFNENTSLSDRTQYLALRSLTINHFFHHPLLEHLQYLFPALDRVLCATFTDLPIPEDRWVDIRAANQRAQEGDSESHSHPWKRLDQLICNIPLFYILALRCPIRLVSLDACSLDHRTFATQALRENPPPRLKVSLLLHDGLGVFDELFPPELAETLTHLTLCIDYSNICYGLHYPANAHAIATLQWDHLMERLLQTVLPLHHLTHLRIVIQADIRHPFSGLYGRLPCSEDFVQALRDPALRLEKAALSLAGVLTSARYVFLTTRGFLADRERSDDEWVYTWRVSERWLISRAWRVAGPWAHNARESQSESSLVELDEAFAEMIMEQEELFLSLQDEINHTGGYELWQPEPN